MVNCLRKQGFFFNNLSLGIKNTRWGSYLELPHLFQHIIWKSSSQWLFCEKLQVLLCAQERAELFGNYSVLKKGEP